MISQVNWEDDVIWSPEEVKPNLQAMARAGWIPTGLTRTAHAYAIQQQTLFHQLGTVCTCIAFSLSVHTISGCILY